MKKQKETHKIKRTLITIPTHLHYYACRRSRRIFGNQNFSGYVSYLIQQDKDKDVERLTKKK